MKTILMTRWTIMMKTEDYEEAIGGDYDEYPYGPPSDWSCIMGFSP